VPVEPPPTDWDLPDPAVVGSDEHGVVALGADLRPGTLLAAYRHGLFPMHVDRGRHLAWWSPDPRGVLLGPVVLTKSLRRSLRRYEIRVDTAFAEVVSACADPSRPHAWINRDIEAAYARLHELGWAHSVEAWSVDDGTLAGGLYGVGIGGLFAGESMFFRRTDASKAALCGLVDLVRADGDPRRLIDVQWSTPHLASLGVVDLPRVEYLRRLAAALEAPLPEPWR
jgi:leucyl/phenylalanyl-tRNA--protein transferase